MGKKKSAVAEIWDKKLGKWVKESERKPEVPRSVSQELKFKLIVPRDIMDKISWWMHKAENEVSGFGSLDFDEKTNTFTVRDAILLKQEVGPASAEIDPHAMAKAMFRMKDERNGLKWHWHSHVNMGVFWSADDMEIIRSLGQRGWILATVFNYAEEHRTAYFTQSRVPNPIGKDSILHDVFMDDLPTTVINYIPKVLHEAWDAEYAENVTEEKMWRGGLPFGEWDYGGDLIDATKSKGTDDVHLSDSKINYNDHGYAMSPGLPNGGILYNPCFDKELCLEERIEMIDEMDPDEIDFLEKHSISFQMLMRDYMVREASEVDLGINRPHGML